MNPRNWIAIASLMLGACGGEVGSPALAETSSAPSDAGSASPSPSVYSDDLCGIPISGGSSQIFATVYQGDDPAAPCDGCSITGERNVIDTDRDNFASIDFPRSALFGIGELSVEMQHGIVYAAGDIAGFTIAIPPAMYSASVPTDAAGNGIPQFTIETGLSGTDQWESRDFGRLPAAQVAGLMAHADRFFIGYQTTKPFNDVALIARAGGVVVNRHVHVFEACGNAPTTGEFPGDPS